MCKARSGQPSDARSERAGRDWTGDIAQARSWLRNDSQDLGRAVVAVVKRDVRAWMGAWRLQLNGSSGVSMRQDWANADLHAPREEKVGNRD
jgi:hypothetical protein